MPVLSNPRWERFAQCIVQGLADRQGVYSQGRAYQAAGYAAKDAGKSGGSAEAAASRLLKRVKPVLDRVAELQSASARRKQVTIETIVDELDEARGIAKDEKQTSAMVSATTTKAKILGLQIDRSEVGKPGDFTSISTSDELASRMLLDAGASIVTDDMKAMAIAELERHARALAAIAQGEPASDVLPGSMNKRSSTLLQLAKPLASQHNQA